MFTDSLTNTKTNNTRNSSIICEESSKTHEKVEIHELPRTQGSKPQKLRNTHKLRNSISKFIQEKNPSPSPEIFCFIDSLKQENMLLYQKVKGYKERNQNLEEEVKIIKEKKHEEERLKGYILKRNSEEIESLRKDRQQLATKNEELILELAKLKAKISASNSSRTLV